MSSTTTSAAFEFDASTLVSSLTSPENLVSSGNERTFVNIGVQVSLPSSNSAAIASSASASTTSSPSSSCVHGHVHPHHNHHHHTQIQHQVHPQTPLHQYSVNTPYPSPPANVHSSRVAKANSDTNSNRFTYSDLGYESLHSTPKYLGTTRDQTTNEPSIGGDSAECCCLPEEDEDDDDDDDDDSVELNRSRDPIRRRISVTTKENHCVNPPSKHNQSNNHRASVRHCQLRRYLFKWWPSRSSSKRKNRRVQELTIGDDDSELVEIKEEKIVVSSTAGTNVLEGGGGGGAPGGGPSEGREEWGKKMDFLLSIIGFAVDLSNVWRFPYLCYKNGGGVFLIPYTIMLLFGALPLFFMELSLGQFAKSGPISIWDKICPPLKGIGYCFVLISWYVSFYYNVIIAWTTNYVIKTLISGEEMPWQHCTNEFNTPNCISMDDIRKLCGTRDEHGHRNSSKECSKLSNRTSPTEEFFNLGLLQIDKADGFSNMGILRPELIGCLIIVFITLYFSLFKGVKSSGKVVWVTATAPYFILTILLARGLFLPGALSGIKYYISPRLEMLADPNVWVDAAVQVFYSIGVGFGVHLTYASFNKFNNNCYADCLVTACVNSLTSFYSGFVIFTYLGYMAYSMDKEIQNVASEGYGLVFQVYPEAISTLPFAKFWSILFFFMLLTLGIDSAMGGLESVITGLMDEFNLHKKIRREVFTAIIICGSFLGALINCTQGGAFTMVWFDTYSAGISLLCSAMFEALAVTYFYGIDRFCHDIESMIGHPPSWYFQISWKYISPIFLSTVIIMSILNSESLTYYGYNFPFWATFFGWMFTLSSISAVPIYLLIWCCRNWGRKGSLSFGQQRNNEVKGQQQANQTDHQMMLKNHYITGADAKTQHNSELNNSSAVFV